MILNKFRGFHNVIVALFIAQRKERGTSHFTVAVNSL